LKPINPNQNVRIFQELKVKNANPINPRLVKKYVRNNIESLLTLSINIK